MMQGDSYRIPFEILKADGSAVTDSDILDLEISVGFLKKKYSAGEIIFSEKKWLFPLTQQETFSIPPTRIKIQARLKHANGDIEGYDVGYYNVLESISKEAL